MNTLTLTKNIPVRAEYDCIVCGGGCAGFVAAISASRAGLRTALIERYGFLGGTATAGYVVPISGFYFKEKRVVGGIAWEFVQRLEAQGAAMVELPKGHVSVHPENYKLVAEQMVEESGVELYTNTVLIDSVTDGEKITHIILNDKSGTYALTAKTFIDATGDGDLAYMSGAPMRSADSGTMQPLSLCFVIENVDATTDLLKPYIHHNGRDAKQSVNTVIREYLLSCPDAPQFGGPWFNTLLLGNSLAVNVTRAGCDATDPRAFAAAERKLRRDMFRILALLREKFPEFKDSAIVSSAINAGIRETRHLIGKRTATLQSFLDGTTYACPAAHSAHPMDIHDPKSAAQQLIRLENNAFVPCDALVCEQFNNLIVAGRCLSAEAAPYASIRVQATLMSTGEAAGLMAKLSQVSDAPVHALKESALCAMIAERNFVL
jgi:hypothetical protein